MLKILAILTTCIPLLASAQSIEDFVQPKTPSPKVLAQAAAEKDAEDSNQGRGVADMFEKMEPLFAENSAATTFAKETSIGKSPSVGVFDDAAGVKTKATPKVKQAANNDFISDKYKNAYPKSREEILKTFGDPSEDTPLKAIDNAPTPFKAMMAAVQSGDKELSFSYARQYVRYIKNMKGSLQDMNKMTDMAMQVEGMRAPLSEEDPRYDEYRSLIEKDLEGLRGDSEDGLYTADMTPEVKAMLAKAELAENRGVPRATAIASREKQFPTGYEPDFNEKQERMRVRQSIAGRVPVDPRGEAHIYVFMKPRDAKSMALAREVEILNKRAGSSSNIKIEGIVASDRLSNEGERQVQTAGKFSFPLRASLELGVKLGVFQYPSVVVAAPNLGAFVLEEGFRPFYYIDELVKAMQGYQLKVKD